MAQGARPRSGRAHSIHSKSAADQNWRAGSGNVLSVEGSLRVGDGAEQPAGLAGFQRLAGRRSAGHQSNSVHGRRQAAHCHLLNCPPQRRGAHVLCFAATQPNAGLDARAIGHHQPARAAVHGRNLRLLSAHGQPALQKAAAHAAQASARVRAGHTAGHAEPGGPRLQRLVERRHVVDRPPANRARQSARAGRARRGVGQRREQVRPRGDGANPGRAGQPYLFDEQHARGCARDSANALGAFVFARAADAQPDQDVDGPDQSRARVGGSRRAEGRGHRIGGRASCHRNGWRVPGGAAFPSVRSAAVLYPRPWTRPA